MVKNLSRTRDSQSKVGYGRIYHELIMSSGVLMRSMRVLGLGSVLILGGMAVSSAVFAQTAQTGAVKTATQQSPQAHQAGSQFIYAESVKDASYKKIVDDKLSAKQHEIDALQARVTALKADHKANQAELDRLSAQLAEAQDRFVTEIAQKDRALSALITTMRQSVDRILETPEGLKAIELLNTGDIDSAEKVLDDLAVARQKARQIKADLETAADLRANAALLLGKVSTNNSISRYEAVTALDPGLHWDWITLSRLYQQAGDLPKAAQAAQRAADTASDDRDKARALDEKGGILILQGDLVSAKKLFEDSLSITRRLFTETPSSINSRRDLSIALASTGYINILLGNYMEAKKYYIESNDLKKDIIIDQPENLSLKREYTIGMVRLGDIYMAEGDYSAAIFTYNESIVLRRELLLLDPTNVEAKCDLGVGLGKLGEAEGAEGNILDAYKADDEALKNFRDLIAHDPTNMEYKRHLMVTLNHLASLNIYNKKPVEARIELEESRWIATELSEHDPTNAEAKRDLMIVFQRLGNLEVAEGHISEATKDFESGLNIARDLASRSPNSARAKMDVIISIRKLTIIKAPGYSWKDVLDALIDMKAHGQLAPADEWMIEDAKDQLAKEQAQKH